MLEFNAKEESIIENMKTDERDKRLSELESRTDYFETVVNRQRNRINELEKAITDHYRAFPDEPLAAEVDLWANVGIVIYSDKEGFYKENRSSEKNQALEEDN